MAFITLKWKVGPEKVTASIDAFRVRLFGELREQLKKSMYELREYIVGSKLSGSPLHRRSGNLASSIIPTVEGSWPVSRGSVGVDKSAGSEPGQVLKYANALEYGANIPERVPMKARALHWLAADGSDVFAKRARAFYLQPHSFMRPSLREQRQQIIDGVHETVNRALKAQ